MTAEQKIRNRLQVIIDARPSARVRATATNGRTSRYTGRAYQVVNMAIRWTALGYEDVEISIPRKHGSTLTHSPFIPFPADRALAVTAVREFAADPSPFAGQWRRFLKRLEPEEMQS